MGARLLHAIVLGSFCLGAGAAWGSIPGPPPWAKAYRRVWAQDFTTMTRLEQLGVSDTRIGTGTWIAHTPSSTDWFTFASPTANNHPFGVGNGYLTIRVQKDGHDPNNWFAGYSGGLLSSMDGAGKGFAQQYGYFECSMWTPGTPNTWPAFWLLDAPSLTDPSLDGAEIDVTESYGNWGTGPGQQPPGDPNNNSVTWHLWGKNGRHHKANGSFTRQPGMTTGFHTYGVDIEPTGIAWYFDRKQVWQAPIYPEAQRPMYVLLNLALGGGNHNNATGDGYDWSLTPDPTDLKVQYVAVWASPASPNYTGPPAPPTNLRATRGNRLVALAWQAGLGAESYTVSRDGTAIAAGVKETRYIDRSAANGRAYSYRVAAVGARGTSEASAAVSARPAPGPPIDPADLKAIPGDGQMSLAWSPSPDAAWYNVYRGTAAGTEGAAPIATRVTKASYVDKGVTNGQPYFYTVAAAAPGGTSRRSNEASGIPALAAETVGVACARKAPNVDDLAAWAGATAFPVGRLGLGPPTTTSGTFQMMWDATNLHYLFTVLDQTLVKGTPDYNGDAVEMYIDARNSKGAQYDETTYRYTLGYGYAAPTEPAHNAVDGVNVARKEYPGGYRVHVAIPWSTLGVKPFAGMSLGLDVAIDDGSSAARGRTSALFWHDNSANDYQNPGLFGNATLQPPSPPAAPADGVYRVVNVTSGKVLQVPGASTANVALDQATWNGGTHQQWRVKHLGGGSYSLQNVKSGSVVDCSPTFDLGHQAVQWPITGTPSETQRFALTAVGAHWLLTNVYSGRALDVKGSSKDDGAAIVQSACTASGSQRWDLVAVADTGR